MILPSWRLTKAVHLPEELASEAFRGQDSVLHIPRLCPPWYVKCLYKHLFLEDTSKHPRVTKKIAPSKWEHV